MADIFISYARKDKAFVERLHGAFCEAGASVWIDLQDIPPAAEFMQEIYQGIEAAHTFLFVVSPISAVSEVCNLEVAHAVETNKRIVPLLYREVAIKQLPPSAVKGLLSRFNWVALRGDLDSETTDFADICKELVKVLETDLEYVRDHTRLLVRAKEWETHQYNESYLLQGDDLEEAAKWLGETAQKQPPPTELHHHYIDASTKHDLEESHRWEELYRTADENRRKAERALAAFYKEQGRVELLNGNGMQGALYLSEAYKMGLDDAALRFLLARAMETVDAQLRTLKGHKGLVEAARFSPDGEHVVTASADKTARVWNVSNGELAAVLEGHSAPIHVAAYSRDGRYLATGGDDRLVNIWEAKSYQLHRRLEGHTGSVGAVVFSPDGELLLTAHGELYPEKEEPIDTSARVWDVGTGTLLLTLDEHTAAVSSAIFSPKGTIMATASLDGSVKIWDRRSGKCLATHLHFEEDDKEKGSRITLAFSPDGRRLVIGGWVKMSILDFESRKMLSGLQAHLGPINTVAFSPDGKLIATASLDKSAIVWDAEKGEAVSELRGHKSSVTSAIFSPDGCCVLTASMDGKAKLWEAKSGRLIQSFEGHRAEMVDANFNGDGTLLVTASWDGTAKLWNVSNNRFRSFMGCEDSMATAAFHADGTRMVSANIDSDEPVAEVWDCATATRIFSLKGHEGLIEFVGYSGGGRYIITAGEDKVARLWDAKSGDVITTLVGHANTVKCAAFSGDGQIVATASYDGTTKLWKVPGGELCLTLEQQDTELICVRFSPDSTMVVTAGTDGKARAWERATGKLLFSLEHADALHALLLSDDGKYILTASADGTACLWSSVDGRLLRTLKGHSGNVFAVDMSNDNEKVVTASADKSAKIWEVASGQLLCSLDDHEGMVWDAQFSPDDRFVMTIDTEGQAAKIWDAASGALLSRLENPTGMTTCAMFRPDGRGALTTQAKVIFNPNVHMSRKTYSTSGSTLVMWNLLSEIRDAHQIGLLIKERVPLHIREGRLLPVMEFNEEPSRT